MFTLSAARASRLDSRRERCFRRVLPAEARCAALLRCASQQEAMRQTHAHAAICNYEIATFGQDMDMEDGVRFYEIEHEVADTHATIVC
eukprot:6187261-Pleurochrysis_carterae.AAC.1